MTEPIVSLSEEELEFIRRVKSNQPLKEKNVKKNSKKLTSNFLLFGTIAFAIIPFIVVGFFVYYLEQAKSVLGKLSDVVLNGNVTNEELEKIQNTVDLQGIDQLSTLYGNKSLIIIAIFGISFIIAGILFSLRVIINKKENS